MSEYTPGPWTFRRSGYPEEGEIMPEYTGRGYSENPGIFGAVNDDLVVGCDEYNVFSNPRQAANVRLLLAAPDLLESLEALLANYQSGAESGDWGNFDFEEIDAVKWARAAIAKATGSPA